VGERSSRADQRLQMRDGSAALGGF
jgi:hypothetical protein